MPDMDHSDNFDQILSINLKFHVNEQIIKILNSQMNISEIPQDFTDEEKFENSVNGLFDLLSHLIDKTHMEKIIKANSELTQKINRSDITKRSIEYYKARVEFARTKFRILLSMLASYGWLE